MQRKRVRVVLGVVVGLCVLSLATSAVGASGGTHWAVEKFRTQSNLSMAEREPLAEPRPNTTVVTSDDGHMFALAPNGTLRYFAASHDGYWDVDPSPVGESTVLYSATDRIAPADSACNSVEDDCIRQQIERVNLTTGAVTQLYSTVGSRYAASQWHDVDRVNESHYLVADMARDRVFIVDVRTGLITWEWTVQSALPLSSGGDYPRDWSHINDVELLPDGRIMASLRNHDRVVFLDTQSGLQPNWTLGSEDDYDILYEQHNPDYIPASRGGPAVVVADSENNRIVEYQRVDGEWVRSWEWQDFDLQWPRDADRLPNGNTLVADTHGQRILEVAPSGEIVWQAQLGLSYEVERLSTGDESATGHAARTENYRNQSSDQVAASSIPTLDQQAEAALRGIIPNKWLNAAAHARPDWMEFWDQFTLLFAVVVVLTWLLLEAVWAPYRLRSPLARTE